MRRDNVRDFEANLLKPTLNDVEVEPKLQKTDDEELNILTDNDARPDIRARGALRQGQNAFFDIRLSNTNARSQKKFTSKCYSEKTRKKQKASL